MPKIACLLRPRDASYRANCAILVENDDQRKQLRVVVADLVITNDDAVAQAQAIVERLGFGEVIEYDRLPRVFFKFTIPRPA